MRPAEGAATAIVWYEARKALAAASWTWEREMYRFAWTRYERRLSDDGRRVRGVTYPGFSPDRGSGRSPMTYSATGRPPIRCSRRMRSSTGGSQPRYQIPSG